MSSKISNGYAIAKIKRNGKVTKKTNSNFSISDKMKGAVLRSFVASNGIHPVGENNAKVSLAVMPLIGRFNRKRAASSDLLIYPLHPMYTAFTTHTTLYQNGLNSSRVMS